MEFSLHPKQSVQLKLCDYDPLNWFDTPEALRRISYRIDSEYALIRNHIQEIAKLSHRLIGNDDTKIRVYLDKRQYLVELMRGHFVKGRRIIREALPTCRNRHELDNAYFSICHQDDELFWERAALTLYGARIRFGMFSRQVRVKVGNAYVFAIKKFRQRPEETWFRPYFDKNLRVQRPEELLCYERRLCKAYHPEAAQNFRSGRILSICPFAGFEVYSQSVAHFLSPAIGEDTIAYIFGCDPTDGHEILWSEQSAFMTSSRLKHMLAKGELVIIPDPVDTNEFLSIILCQEALDQDWSSSELRRPIGTIHKQRLIFRTATRPSKRNLYLHAILSCLRRRRLLMQGWENDVTQVFNKCSWASLGKVVRRGMMQALASEISDDCSYLVDLAGVADIPSTKSAEEEKRLATLVRYSMEIHCEMSEFSEDHVYDSGDENLDYDKEEEQQENGNDEEVVVS